MKRQGDKSRNGEKAEAVPEGRNICSHGCKYMVKIKQEVELWRDFCPEAQKS